MRTRRNSELLNLWADRSPIAVVKQDSVTGDGLRQKERERSMWLRCCEVITSEIVIECNVTSFNPIVLPIIVYLFLFLLHLYYSSVIIYCTMLNTFMVQFLRNRLIFGDQIFTAY
jgi:Na+/H+-translocating membrane pyrophosphatase